MKEICIINERSNASIYGIGTFLNEYIECLERINIKINIVELDFTQKEFEIKERNGVTTFLFPYQYTPNRENYFCSIVHICRFYIKDSAALIFHLHYASSDFLMKKIKEYYPLSKIFYTIHYQSWAWLLNGNMDLYYRIINKMHLKSIQGKYAGIVEEFKKEKLIYEHSDRLICLSTDTFNIVKNVYQQDECKIKLIPNGLKDKKKKIRKKSLSKIRSAFLIEEDTKILLYVGRLDKLKGIEVLINCFNKAVKQFPRCRLVIAGGAGNFSDIVPMTRSAASKITFTGALSREKLAHWYQIADIGIIPSYAEQCSYVAIEMMMYGLPIIVSDGIGIRNMFQNEINGKIASIGNRKTPGEFRNNLYNAMIELISSPECCVKLGENARELYEIHYRQEKMELGYKSIINSIITPGV